MGINQIKEIKHLLVLKRLKFIRLLINFILPWKQGVKISYWMHSKLLLCSTGRISCPLAPKWSHVSSWETEIPHLNMEEVRKKWLLLFITIVILRSRIPNILAVSNTNSLQGRCCWRGFPSPNHHEILVWKVATLSWTNGNKLSSLKKKKNPKVKTT